LSSHRPESTVLDPALRGEVLQHKRRGSRTKQVNTNMDAGQAGRCVCSSILLDVKPIRNMQSAPHSASSFCVGGICIGKTTVLCTVCQGGYGAWGLVDFGFVRVVTLFVCLLACISVLSIWCDTEHTLLGSMLPGLRNQSHRWAAAVSGCWPTCHSLFVSWQSTACDDIRHTASLWLYSSIAASIAAKCTLALHQYNA
jgi:hypothetical protein